MRIAIDFNKRIGNLQSSLVDCLLQGRGEGWRWEISVMVKSLLSVVFLREIYHAAGKGDALEENFRRAEQDAKYIITGFDPTVFPVGILYDLAERIELLGDCFSSPDGIDYCLRRMGGSIFLDAFASALENNLGYERHTRRELIDCLIFLKSHNRVGIKAFHEIGNRFKAFPDIVQKMLGRFQDVDEGRRITHWGATEDYLHRTAHKYKLSDNAKDDFVEQVDENFAPLVDKDFRAQLVWIEENHKDLLYLPRRISDRAKNFWKQQQWENEHVQSLEAPQGEKETPLIEIILAPSQSIEPKDKITVGCPFTDSQRERIKKVFRKVKGANSETGTAIVEYMTANEVGAERGDYKQIANALGIAESTVGRYLGTRNRKGIINLIADELVGTYLSDKIFREK